MSPRDPQIHAAVSELANALQTAVPLVTRIRQGLADRADDVRQLELTLHRAARAVRSLAPDRGGAR